MKPAARVQLSETWGPWAIVFASAAFSFAELIPAGYRSEAILPFLQLTAGALGLAAAGWAVSALCDFRFAAGNLALQIGISQVVLLIWAYVRSLLSAAFENIAGIPLPLSAVELLLVVLLLVVAAARTRPLPSVAMLSSGLPWIVVAIFLISQRELPRESMLSSDPDQHLYFATQILRLGVIPFHQATWGPQDLGYPAGFAALSALWSWLGSVSAPNAVTVQPLLQTLLALLAISSVATRFVAAENRSLHFASGYFALLLFFGFFPYTLTGFHYHLEKTGSISSLLMLLTTAILAMEAGLGPNARSRSLMLHLCGASVGISALMNPTAAIVPGVLYGLAVTKALWGIRRSLGLLSRSLLQFCCVPLAVVLSDPYYLHRFVLHRPAGQSALPLGGAPDESIVGAIIVRVIEMIESFYWLRPFLLLPYFGRTALAIAVIAVAITALLILLPKDKRLSAFRLLVAIPVLIVALEFALLPIFFALRTKGDLYLLEPYFADALARFAYLWYLSILLLVLALLYKRLSPLPLGAGLCILIVTIFMIPVRSARDHLQNDVRMDVRFNRCSALGCINDDDRAVLNALRDRYTTYLALGGSTEYNQTPKVLLPNTVSVINRERWIMPTGASVILPLTRTFPAAFFYHQGSRDYSYQNYVDHVCAVLDLDWLKQRNIRFLYVPTARKNVCVSGLDALLRDGSVLVRVGDAALIELF